MDSFAWWFRPRLVGADAPLSPRTRHVRNLDARPTAPAAASVGRQPGVKGVTERFTYSWTKTCAVQQRVWSCPDYRPATACSETCSVIPSTARTGRNTTTVTVTVIDLEFAGYTYFCVQDTSASIAYAWNSDQYCIQNLILKSITSDAIAALSTWGTLAVSPEQNVTLGGTFMNSLYPTRDELVQMEWLPSCNVTQSVYDCDANAAIADNLTPIFDVATRCSLSTYCTFLGSSTGHHLEIYASRLQTGLRYARHTAPGLVARALEELPSALPSPTSAPPCLQLLPNAICLCRRRHVGTFAWRTPT